MRHSVSLIACEPFLSDDDALNSALGLYFYMCAVASCIGSMTSVVHRSSVAFGIRLGHDIPACSPWSIGVPCP